MHLLVLLGTWQTYIVKDQNAWPKIDKVVTKEYVAIITVNPLSALLHAWSLHYFELRHCSLLQFLSFFFFGFLSGFICAYSNFIILGMNRTWQFADAATGVVGCVIQLAKSQGIDSLNILRDRCSFEGSFHVSWGSILGYTLFDTIEISLVFYKKIYILWLTFSYSLRFLPAEEDFH